MTIGIKTHKMLWGRAANRCSICRIELIEDTSNVIDKSNIGEEHHIITKKDGGKDEYENLVLFCRNHHKIVHSDEIKYPKEKQYEIKKMHEEWVRDKLQNYDESKQKDDELYSVIIDEWVSKIDLYEWEKWSSGLLASGGPVLSEEFNRSLGELCPWLLSRFWPGIYPELESAFLNFRLVLNDMHNLFNKHSYKLYKDEDFLRTKQFYKIQEWDPKRYELLLRQYVFHVDLVQDLIFELTRAANLIIERIREFIMPSFREKEGKALVMRGLDEHLRYHTILVGYTGEERKGIPYPGLEEFKNIRKQRDYFIGDVD
jgi:hypothetical protein